MKQETKISRADPIVIAAWCGTVFGLLEGTVLAITRAYPRVRAPYKVSEDILWVAPLENLFVYVLSAVVLTVLFTAGPKKLQGGIQLLIVFFVYTVLGLLAATVSSGIIHLLAAAILAIGGGVSLFRAVRGREQILTRQFRSGVILIPIVIGLSWAGTEVYRWRQESRMVKQLPVVENRPSNVLVIVLDTVRFDSFADNGESSLTPHIDRIAAQGTQYTNAWSTSSWSLPSQASIMTGLYPHEHGADWPGIEIDGQCDKLADYFAERGYVTGAFSSNSAWITSEHLGRGFLRFHDYTIENLLRRTFVGRLADKVLCRIGYHSAGRGKKASRLNRDILRFLDDYPDRPFYAYVCYMDVNREFHNHFFNSRIGKKQPLSTTYLAYKSALTTLDGQVGRLLEELNERRRLDNTIIVITSDHGESFGAEVGNDHEPSGHGSSLYYEQSKVPLFVIYPPKVPAKHSVDATVSIRQIPSTILKLLDSDDAPFPGKPLPLETDDQTVEVATEEDPVLITLNYDKYIHQSVVLDQWQYIHNPTDAAVPEELYDLQTDPESTTNLAPDHDRIGRMRVLLKQLMNGQTEAIAKSDESSSSSVGLAATDHGPLKTARGARPSTAESDLRGDPQLVFP